MNVFELLTVNEPVLTMLADKSIDVSDVKYLEMYRDYRRLSIEGHKKTYIIQYLVDEYGMSEATIYRVIKRFSEDIEV